MAIALLILSNIFFISTFGIYSIQKENNDFHAAYLNTPLALIPIICAFIIPVISLSYLLDYSWILLAIGNTIFVVIFGPFITKAYMVRLSTGNLGKDLLYTMGLGTVSLILGIIFIK